MQGTEEGERRATSRWSDAPLEVLETRFSEIPVHVREQVEAITIPNACDTHRRAVTIESLESLLTSFSPRANPLRTRSALRPRAGSEVWAADLPAMPVEKAAWRCSRLPDPPGPRLAAEVEATNPAALHRGRPTSPRRRQRPPPSGIAVLSNTGSSCLPIARVAGVSRVPEPPARMMPFRSGTPQLPSPELMKHSCPRGSSSSGRSSPRRLRARRRSVERMAWMPVADIPRSQSAGMSFAPGLQFKAQRARAPDDVRKLAPARPSTGRR